MTSVDYRARIRRAVAAQVDQVVQGGAFKEWRKSVKIAENDLVIFNNSFLYRPGSTGTTKSQYYLCLRAGVDGVLVSPPLVLTHPTHQNSPFAVKKAKAADDYTLRDLDTAIDDELPQLGAIVFSLAGRIGEDEPGSIPIEKVSGLHTLRYDPNQVMTAAIEGGVVTVNLLDDFAVAWSAVLEIAGDAAIQMREDAGHFEQAFDELCETAGKIVHVDDLDCDGPSILTEVARQLRDQSAAYEALLNAERQPSTSEPGGFNELLRLAYNFADGVKALVTLVVGISDLKPLLFWLSINDQSTLAEHFGALPFASLGKTKASVDDYRTIVAGARNRAFHDLFSFGRPLIVNLTGDAIRTPRLRLFRAYRTKLPALDFEDRKLTNLLVTFTRAPERTVPLEFWERNHAIMIDVISIAENLQASLVLLDAARRASRSGRPGRATGRRRSSASGATPVALELSEGGA